MRNWRGLETAWTKSTASLEVGAKGQSVQPALLQAGPIWRQTWSFETEGGLERNKKTRRIFIVHLTVGGMFGTG